MSENKQAKSYIDYKNVETLKQYLSPQGKILPRRLSRISTKKQRKIALAIKRARYMGLLPFVVR